MMRWEPQQSHRSLWQSSENWRSFHMDSVFIVRSDHQNSSHRAAGGRGGGWLHLITAMWGELVLISPRPRQGETRNRLLSCDYRWSSWDFRSHPDPYTKQGFQLFCDWWWWKLPGLFMFPAIQLEVCWRKKNNHFISLWVYFWWKDVILPSPS
jgi:hypothetical protein